MVGTAGLSTNTLVVYGLVMLDINPAGWATVDVISWVVAEEPSDI